MKSKRAFSLVELTLVIAIAAILAALLWPEYQRVVERARSVACMGSSLEFADFRNYVPGDDPRRIDWNIYGRIERLMMKLYEEEEELDVGVLIDCSASMHWRSSDASHSPKFLLARQLAAALAYFALHGLDHVALWFFDSTLRAESGHYRGIPAFHAEAKSLLRCAALQ